MKDFTIITENHDRVERSQIKFQTLSITKSEINIQFLNGPLIGVMTV